MFGSSTHASPPILAVLTVCIVVLLAPLVADAQCSDNQHTSYGAVGFGPNGEVYDRFCSAYQFEVYYDQSSTVYIVTEPFQGSQKLRWNGWCSGQKIKDLTAATLSDSSHTEPFVVHADSTVTVYRELSWMLNSGGFNPGLYYARDTLDYVIEIADAVTGNRVALLDSIGLLRRVPAGTPFFYGTAPNSARLSWRVPPSLDGASVVLKIGLYVRGDGQYNPGRMDRMTINLSDRLTDPASQLGLIQPN